MIKITVSGKCAEGKTTMSLLIADALRQAGFTVNNTDFDVQESSHGNELMQCQRINALAKKYADDPIVIETVQLRRNAP